MTLIGIHKINFPTQSLTGSNDDGFPLHVYKRLQPYGKNKFLVLAWATHLSVLYFTDAEVEKLFSAWMNRCLGPKALRKAVCNSGVIKGKPLLGNTSLAQKDNTAWAWVRCRTFIRLAVLQ